MSSESNTQDMEPYMDAMAKEIAWRDQDRAALKSAIADIFCAYAEADDPGLAVAIKRAAEVADSTDL